MLDTLVTVVHCFFVCPMLIIIVLLQQGKGADMGATFGGGSNTVFGASGADNLLTRVTTVLAVVFMCTSLYLAASLRPGAGLAGSVLSGSVVAGGSPGTGSPVTDAPGTAGVVNEVAPTSAEQPAVPPASAAAVPVEVAPTAPIAPQAPIVPQVPAAVSPDANAASGGAAPQ